MIFRILFVASLVVSFQGLSFPSSRDLADLKKDQQVHDLRVANLYSDYDGQIVGAKFLHIWSGAPIYLFQIETVPQAFMWVDTPADSNAGLAHSLEHLLASKGTKGRYANLLKEARLSRSAAATTDDFNLYSFSSGTGLAGFFEQFHAWLDALYRPDFTDLEAEREFYHFGISVDPVTKQKSLVEQGAVYDEMQAGQGAYRYYFELNKRVFGSSNPFGFYGGGFPPEMRNVTPAEIHRFYSDHYRLSPATGFIFALAPKEDARRFLGRISKELTQFTPSHVPQPNPHISMTPKYPIEASEDTEIAIFPFPSSGETERGEIRFGWKPVRARSQVEVKLLQLFFRALGDGDKSLSYRTFIDSNTRAIDSGATNVESLVFLGNSPFFPAEFVGFSGIPGNKLTVKGIQQLRSSLAAVIREISQYPDHSPKLAEFNRLVLSYLKAWRRSQSVWLRSAPRFGFGYDTDWKEHLEYLEMDPSFIRSISDESVWTAVGKRIQSGENVWRNLIGGFQLLDVPYATASMPSPQLMQQMEEERKKRIADKLQELMSRFHTNSDQKALSGFEQEEIAKTREIEKIAARVQRPRFTDHPPLTADDEVQYRQFHIHSVPTIAAFFDHAPTIDLGLSFDLRKVPRTYYKYLPILPRCLDSLGLKKEEQVTSYADLQAQIQSKVNDFSVSYDVNPVSQRAELRIQASTLTPAEFRRALQLIQQMTTLNYLDVSNVDRLRDIVEKRRWKDDGFDKGDDDYWFMNPSQAFRYQHDPLYLALSSAFTRAHWDDRLKWLLHSQASSEEIARLSAFAEKTLSSSIGLSAEELTQNLKRSKANGLQGELVEYWQKNIPQFPPDQLLAGLTTLAREVEEDLTTGPSKTITDLRELQRIVLTRSALNIDLTLDHASLEKIEPAVADFLDSIPDDADHVRADSENRPDNNPLLANLRRRYNLRPADFPRYVGFEDSRGTTASLVFYADFPGYSNLNRKCLLRQLASNLAAGAGPHTFYMKVQEDGLADGSSVYSAPRLRLLRYYAARTPDITALIRSVNSTAETLAALRDPSLVDYALQETFPIPRSMSTFTDRGRGIAKDIRDGIDPAKVRRFSQAILRLRADPDLLSELTSTAMDSVCPVLIKQDCLSQQRQSRSLFFLIGPERLLADAEKKLAIPKLLRAYPSDFWIDYPAEPKHERQQAPIGPP
jgi:hypothetical protein